MCATIGRSAARIRRRRSSNTRPRATANIRASIFAGWAGVMQADAFAGYNALYEAPASRRRSSRPLLGARQAQILRPGETDQGADRDRGRAPHRRAVRHRARRSTASRPTSASAARQDHSKPLVAALEAYMREQRARSRRRTKSPRRSATCLIAGRRSRASSTTDGSAFRTTPPNARCAAWPSGSRNWTFAGSDEGGRRAAAVYSLIETCKLNDVDPQAWLADVLAKLPDHPAKRSPNFCHGIGKPPRSPQPKPPCLRGCLETQAGP